MIGLLWAMKYMNPSEVSNTLRKIASMIDNSKRPLRHLVAEELNKVVSQLDAEPQVAPVAQQEQQALPKSNSGKSMLQKMLADAGEALEKGDDSAFKSLLQKALENS